MLTRDDVEDWMEISSALVHAPQTARPVAPSRLGVVVGLAAEARLVRETGWPVSVGGGTPAGAEAATERLVAGGAGALVSFGLAGGLDPRLQPGHLVVPVAVICGARRYATDAALSALLGGCSGETLLAVDTIVVEASTKQALWRTHSTAVADMESGAIARVAARHGLPFAVLRAVCDPADRTLPPAALTVLNRAGSIGMRRLLSSVATNPWQVATLIALARDAAAARQALAARVQTLAR
jgi:adenosylhomocysteine nucleosidase